MSFPGGASGKEPACQYRRCKRQKVRSLGVGKIPWRRKWQPTPVFLPENPTDRGGQQATVHRVTESDTTERAHVVRRAPPSVHLAARVSVFRSRTGQGGAAHTGQICAFRKSRPKEIQIEDLLIHSLMSWVFLFNFLI